MTKWTLYGLYAQVQLLYKIHHLVQAKVIGTSVNEKGRPFLPPEIDNLFKNYTQD